MHRDRAPDRGSRSRPVCTTSAGTKNTMVHQTECIVCTPRSDEGDGSADQRAVGDSRLSLTDAQRVECKAALGLRCWNCSASVHWPPATRRRV